MTGSEPQSDDDDKLLTRLQRVFDGQYVVERRLAVGGMAQLFLATDPVLGRALVIKILPPELTSELSIARFRRESELTAHLQHPHILPIIAAGERDGLLYYVMPYVAGESLRSRLDREGALAVADAVEILEEVADALTVAHRHGVIHRDIKPENILLQEGHAVLADFGIAGALEGATSGGGSGQRLTRTGMSLGTIGYMAPEQALGESNVDGRADIYALGIVGHEMIAGQRPFDGSTVQEVMIAHLTKEPPRLDVDRDDVPPAVADAILLALRKEPENRFQTAQEFRDALRWSMTSTGLLAVRTTRTTGVPDAPRATPGGGVRRWTRARWVNVVAPLVLLLAIASAFWAWRNSRTVAPTELVTIAIAPFALLPDDPTSELQLWREGMVDILARNLDGAGPLRTVSPTLVLRNWEGVPTRATAVALANRTNAQYAVYGRFTASGEEGVRISASLVTATDSVVWDFERVDTTVEVLSDSLTVALIAELGTRHQLGAARRSFVGSANPLALKAFLQGEQHYRRTAWDSANASYMRAVREDSAFAPALRRVASVRQAQSSRDDSTAREFALRAGARNRGRGLAPRDSLLILADSLEAALFAPVRSPDYWDIVRRLFASLAEATARYPDDPEIWFTLGEARYHHGYGSVAAVTEAATLDAFERSIHLDSAFAPAYSHAVSLALKLEGAEKALAYGRRYLALDPGGKDAAVTRVVVAVVDSQTRDLPATRTLLDTISTDVLFDAWRTALRWPDSTDTALRLLQAVDRRPHASPTFVRDSTLLRSYMSLQLAYRGRLQESFATLGMLRSRLIVELALLDAIPAKSAARTFASWVTSPDSTEWAAAQWALPWWAEQRDTATIARYRASVQARGADGEGERAMKQYRLDAAGAYLALARADSAAAREQLGALSDTVCLVCYMDRIYLARLLIADGDDAALRRASALLDERLFTWITPVHVWRASIRGSVLQRLQQHEAAADAYGLVSAAWSGGDPSLQPYVQEAQAALQSLRARRSGENPD